ncbi:LytR/AlgR family response regulator transcription factor [Pedobacter mendelii]|uniref:DNA-binding response regulator n=1 Tax=Pedobacter mendelii TaxID=1908240 RepID=A0ABQ2BLK7_9SPHI|nr:LytTR family DNA-binding domain-containing protein [Pedobacter mendelii]GGI29101.1 DNA-binding response regulator [Pedobacter mendelii]
MIRCIAIDDQLTSLEGLEKYILETPNMRLVKSFTDPVLALKELSREEPVDLIFMDINMPQISGIELAQALKGKSKKLIFTSAHKEYAFEAYEAEGDAFLPKPYSYAKFLVTVNRLFADQNEAFENSLEQTDSFLVKNKEEDYRAIMIKYTDIIAFESFHNYVKIHTDKKVIIAYLSLKDVREQLNISKQFAQFHRAYIISIPHILHIEGQRITLSNHISFTVGNVYLNEFKEFFNERVIISSRKK